jgi:hypothetical protein
MLTAANKLLLISESRGDSNWCTPCRGNLINTPHTFHSQCVYGHRPYVSHMVRILQPFASRQLGWTDALPPRKSAPDSTSQPGWVAHRTRLSFSRNITTEAVRLSQALVDTRLLSLLGPYHQYAISTFHTCSRGPTHWSLTDKGGGTTL